MEKSKQSGGSSPGDRRLDNDDGEDVPGNTRIKEAESKAEKHALEGAKKGFDEAKRAPRNEFDYTEQQIEQMVA